MSRAKSITNTMQAYFITHQLINHEKILSSF